MRKNNINTSKAQILAEIKAIEVAMKASPKVISFSPGDANARHLGFKIVLENEARTNSRNNSVA